MITMQVHVLKKQQKTPQPQKELASYPYIPASTHAVPEKRELPVFHSAEASPIP